eukprot:COSAG02_NODE_4465_length_5334_cov_5.927412_4_plen_138_part_00
MSSTGNRPFYASVIVEQLRTVLSMELVAPSPVANANTADDLKNRCRNRQAESPRSSLSQSGSSRAVSAAALHTIPWARAMSLAAEARQRGLGRGDELSREERVGAPARSLLAERQERVCKRVREHRHERHVRVACLI